MESKKSERRIFNGEEEKEEEQRMEEFFSLIRRFHEARNRRRVELIMEEKEKKKNSKIRRLDEGNSSWVPSFAWEDFTAQIEFRKQPPLIFSTAGRNCHKELEDGKKQELDFDDDHGLDLNLTL